MYFMLSQQLKRTLCLAVALAGLSTAGVAAASEYHGQVMFGGLPVPGATVTATQGAKKLVAVTDQQGAYSFADLPDGAWTIAVEMSCFSPVKQDVNISASAPAGQWELKLLPMETIMAQAKAVTAGTAPVVATVAVAPQPKKDAAKPAEAAADGPKPAEEAPDKSADGFLVNGSVNNAATSQFTLAPAFGNRRNAGKSLYNGGLAVILDNSALDARPFSLSGLDTPRSSYNRVTGVFTFGGPLNIKRLMPKGPNFFVAYQWTRDRNASTLSGIVPTQAQRDELSTIAAVPQAKALFAFYRPPNVVGNSRYNYQVPVLSNAHQDALQSRMDKTLGRKDQVYGGFSFQSVRADGSNLFGFTDTTDTLGINANINWVHRLKHGFILNTGYRFSRLRTQVTPNFENRTDVSGLAGITGNSTSPADWGPPTLIFGNGISTLSDAQSAFNRNRTDALSVSTTWNRGHHFVTFGGDFRRQEFNYLSQQDPRGTFTFSDTASGMAFENFLLGTPTTSSIAFGNADKYLRESVADVFITDDWRLRPELTLNVGARWEYGAPITELKGRLVNLDVAPDFSSAPQVQATSPGKFPNSLIRPDKSGIEPRLALSWRPIPGSTVVVRTGYGIYRDTSVYQNLALSLAQQDPFSKSLSLQNSATCLLTLANGFPNCSGFAADTFAVDPNFRVGYAQNWQLSVQRDLPAALQMTVTYLGIKGTRGVQEFLPNTYPIGGINPCPICPVGFIYRTSGGNSIREAGQLQLRRRLRSGLTASLLYTYAKSLDNDSVLGGQGPVAPGVSQSSTSANAVIAQNWRDLRAERGLSSFDQRHLLTAQLQYTTGMGVRGGSLLTGWRGRVLKEWTVLTQMTAGSGLPETPIYFAPVPGTGISGPIRPSLTGIPLHSGAPPGAFLNSAAYTAPAPGQWGNAGKNSITGPSQVSLNASLARTFRLKDRYNLDLRVDSTNLLNHVVFTAWNTTINRVQPGLPAATNPQFGLPVGTNPMRSLQTTARLRF
jgi:hypothetical protein